MTETTRRLPRPAPGPMPPRWRATLLGSKGTLFENEGCTATVVFDGYAVTAELFGDLRDALDRSRDLADLLAWIARGGSARA